MKPNTASAIISLAERLERRPDKIFTSFDTVIKIMRDLVHLEAELNTKFV
jgi:hypothetical protein